MGLLPLDIDQGQLSGVTSTQLQKRTQVSQLSCVDRGAIDLELALEGNFREAMMIAGPQLTLEQVRLVSMKTQVGC